MTRSTTIVIGVALALALAGWLVARGDDPVSEPPAAPAGTDTVGEQPADSIAADSGASKQGTTKTSSFADRKPVDRVEPDEPPRTQLRLQVLTVRGAPLARMSMRVSVHAPGGASLQRCHGETDEEGVLTCEIDPASRKRHATLDLVVQTQRQPDARGRLTLAAPPDVYELFGEVTVRELPTLLGGEVVNGSGNPVSDARLSIIGSNQESGSTMFSTVPARTDALGRFKVTGDFNGPWMRLVVTHPDTPAILRIWCRRGQDDLRIVLPSKAITVRLLLPDGVDPGLLHARVNIGGGWYGETPNHAGIAVFSNFPPGAVDEITIHLKKDGDPRPLVRIKDITRDADGGTSDPRVDPIDLRGLIRPVTITAVDEAGERIPYPAVGKLVDGKQRPDHRRRGTRDGTVTLLLRADDATDAVVWADGRQPTHLPALATSRRVTLRPGPEVTLEFILPPGEEFEGSVRALLDRTDSKRWPQSRPADEIDDGLIQNGRATLRVNEPGEYQLAFQVYRGVDRHGRLVRWSHKIDIRGSNHHVIRLTSNPSKQSRGR